MSTPKINFFIQAVHRAERRAVPGSGPVDEQLFGLAHRVLTGAQFCRGITRSCRGKPAGKPRCAPIPNNCSRFPAGKVPILKRRCCCSEFELHTQRPAGTISRTILRHSPDFAAGDPDAPIIPNISR